MALLMLNVAFWYCFYKWGAFLRTLKGKLPAAIQKHVTAALSAANVPGFRGADAPVPAAAASERPPTADVDSKEVDPPANGV